ncbi:BON domain-containing protein [Ensifer sp. IC3342]|nr:BON domain-containing protein [Ensifer sp. BRP08]MCA1450875.1 BON domain-containing protein [Ensifer sp. IC3342]
MMNDIRLRQDILDELEYEPSIDAANIGVAVENGIVTLTGHVASFAEKHAAERIAERMTGIRAIAQEIEVRLPEHKKTADDEIASRVLKILAWGAAISDLRDIHVRVEKGFVTLSGTVEWHFQRSAAMNSVRELSGVTGIDNQLKIRPRMDVSDIRHGIREALRRNAEIEADNIDVNVSGSHVTLRGKVQSLRERVMAERAAWSAPGVTAVEDHLTIEDAQGRLGP